MFNKKQKAVVNFETENWAVRKYAPIKPASEFMPGPWKQMPTFTDKKQHKIDSDQTVKACPGIGDYMKTGFVIPAWCDMEIIPSEDGQMVETRYSDPEYNSAFHPADQVHNEVSSVMQKFGVKSAVKLDCPWKIWQPKDWSLLYLPMFFFEGRNYEAIPGVIDHDLGALISPINIMLLEKKVTRIKLGEPLVQVIPIKREKVTARTSALSKTAVDRHNAIIQTNKITFNGWSKWQHAKKTYVVDSHDTDLPGDEA
tara:strand:- start:2078 stop:2842 length:765 start_codon:yes stop_codon:yes gene_type:complete